MSDDVSKVSGDLSRRNFLRNATAVAALGTTAIYAGVGTASEELNLLPDMRYKPLPGSKKLRMGVVGGGFGRSFPWHLHPNCEVTAVADLREDRRQILKEMFSCDNVYGEFHPMLKDPKVEAVAIFTEAPDHAQHCIDVMNAGKHVMCVIPAAISLDHCQQLIDTVKSTGQIYMYGETSCFRPITLLAKDLFNKGSFGRVYYSDGEYTHDVYTDLEAGIKTWFVRDGKRTWRYGYPQGYYIGHGNGPVISVTRDKYTEVVAIGTPHPDDHEIWQDNQYGNPFVNTTFFFKTAGGNSSRIAGHHLTGMPGKEGADFAGTKMALFVPWGEQPAEINYPHETPKKVDVSPYQQLLPPELRDRRGHGGSHSHIIHEFVSACIEERAPSVDVYHAAAITAPGIVGFHSALKGGEMLKIPDFGPIR